MAATGRLNLIGPSDHAGFPYAAINPRIASLTNDRLASGSRVSIPLVRKDDLGFHPQ